MSMVDGRCEGESSSPLIILIPWDIEKFKTTKINLSIRFRLKNKAFPYENVFIRFYE